MSTKAEQIASVAEILEWGRSNPALFIEKYMATELWEKQREIVNDVFTQRRVAVKSCHSSGKTFSAARIVLAFFLLYPNSKVLTTAPTWESVERQLWGELATAYAQMPNLFKGGLKLLQTELRAAADWWAIGLSTDQGVRFQGHHAEHMLVLFDEANGISDEIWEAADSLGAGGEVHYLYIANPLEATGRFHDAFSKNRKAYTLHTISAYDTPNLKGLTANDIKQMSDAELDDNPQPKLITRRYVRHILDTAGEDSDTYRIRIEGEFPVGGTNTVIPLAWVDRAVERWKTWRAAGFPGEMTGVGVDVGLSHDVTVLALRYDRYKIKGLLRFPKENTTSIVGRVLGTVRNTTADIIVDAIGVGAGVYDTLMERQYTHPGGWSAHSFIASQKSLLFDRAGAYGFANRRAEAWWGLREALDPDYNDDVMLPDDPDLIEELTTPTYRPLTGGKYLIESKDDIRSRLGGRSTDSADAVIMALSVERPERARLTGGRRELTPYFQQGVERVTSFDGGRDYDPEKPPRPLLGLIDWTVQ